MSPINATMIGSHWASALVLGFACGVVLAYALRTVFVGRAEEQRVDKEGGTLFLGRWLMEAFYWTFRSFGYLLLKMRVTPDALTWTSFALTMACLPAAAMGHFSTAGLFFLVGSAFDAFDGLVARERGMASDSGEMLDAIIDRYADMAPLVGLAIFYRFSAWQMTIPLVALVGSVMVSYVRAKTEALGLKLPSGVMRRHERIAYFVVGLVAGPEISPWLPAPFGAVHPATLATIGFVAVTSNYAAVRLAAHGRTALLRSGRGPGGKLP
jgi:CDP-diacylglycerol--glycerol-3-phosphate 3-phosphatidyltransferase